MKMRDQILRDENVIALSLLQLENVEKTKRVIKEEKWNIKKRGTKK